MKVTIKPIEDRDFEQVVIECVEVTREIRDIEAFVLGKGTTLSGMEGDRMYAFSLSSVMYFEAVDERVFAYTKERVLEMRTRLYMLEEAYKGHLFVRCSKSVLVNLMNLSSISPSLNGRFTAHMKNGERIVISRQYANALKKAILEGTAHGI